MRVPGLVTLVSGGASGLGAAVARRLVGAGGKVIVSDLNGDAAHALSAIESRVMLQGRTEDSGFPGYLASDPADGAPQLESNGIVALTLQKMLIQTDGRRILLFPAWPRSLDVDAKLHIPAAERGARPATVRVVLRAGKLRTIEVAPESRRADLVLVSIQ